MYEAFLIQLVGFVAWIFLALSYWRKKVDDVLLLQVISCILFVIHYYFLDGMSGLYIVLFETVRDFVYYKSKDDLKLFFYSIPIYIIIGILNFTGIMSILPSLASMIDGFSLANKKMIVVGGGIASYTVWFIYDVYVGSISGAITDFILIISNIFVIIAEYKERNRRKGRKKLA